MDSGSGFVAVSGDPSADLTLTRVITAGVASGQSYNLRYRAKNIAGWGDYSDSITILASSVPDKPVNVRSQNSNAASTVTISWTEPTNTGGTGVPIDAYIVHL